MADLEGLIDSGYLCKTSIIVTNLAGQRKQTHDAITRALKGTGLPCTILAATK